ncbi:MAG: hypothetical protein LVR00_09565 [Rhabdochlamydiaceae bacterium]|jgi:NAD(P)H-hydrate repair Nnr-like enzyme with NAD(P)H-hydrate dehydratase domain
MGGAAALSSLAALRGGAGIVRLFYEKGMGVSMLPPEVIREPYNIKRILEECTRASSLFIGPGLGRNWKIKRLLRKLLPQILQPVVLDADALFFSQKTPTQNCRFIRFLHPTKKRWSAFCKGKHVPLLHAKPLSIIRM